MTLLEGCNVLRIVTMHCSDFQSLEKRDAFMDYLVLFLSQKKNNLVNKMLVGVLPKNLKLKVNILTGLKKLKVHNVWMYGYNFHLALSECM